MNMKLWLSALNGMEWGDPIPKEYHAIWVELFSFMEDISEVSIPRCLKPVSALSKVRLLCLADAAEKAGGCAIYAGYEMPDGSYSCRLVYAKSRIMHNTVPRNELEAILMSAEASLLVQKSLGDCVGEVRYFTDSVIAMCWVLNEKLRLRMWTHNRVKEILNAIRWVVGGTASYPLFHIDGPRNLADLVTKTKELCREDIDGSSAWQTGLPWMRLPTEELPCEQPLHPVDDVDCKDYRVELFPEVHCVDSAEERSILVCTAEAETGASVFVSAATLGSDWSTVTQLYDFRKLGWRLVVKKLSLLFRFAEKCRHAVHQRKKVNRTDCCFCTTDPSIGLERLALNSILLAASKEAEDKTGVKKMEQLYDQKDGVWYSSRRLEKEGHADLLDVDAVPFFDGLSIKKLVPVVLTESAIFAAYHAYVHDHVLDHSGVEATIGEIKRTMMPVGSSSPRNLIRQYKKKCPKCRRRLKETIQKELADFPNCRTTVAPPFYYVQADIAMAFRAKPRNNSNKTFPCHALVLVCLTTSATSILVLDGLATETVVQALERHASRHGMPGHVFVDSGTQLEKLKDTSFDLREINGTRFRQMSFKLTVATPKAHEQQGRVERKIRVLRDMLQKLSSSTLCCNTLIGWETLFCRIASQVDDLPIARGSATAATDLGWEIITPNRLKLGRNNHRNLEGEIVLDNCPQTQLDRNREIFTGWYKLFLERIHLLVPQSERVEDRAVQLGDVVLFIFQDSLVPKFNVWKLGRVVQLISSRTVLVKYSQAGLESKFIRRSIRQMCIVQGVEELSSSPLDASEEM